MPFFLGEGQVSLPVPNSSMPIRINFSSGCFHTTELIPIKDTSLPTQLIKHMSQSVWSNQASWYVSKLSHLIFKNLLENKECIAFNQTQHCIPNTDGYQVLPRVQLCSPEQKPHVGARGSLSGLQQIL